MTLPSTIYVIIFNLLPIFTEPTALLFQQLLCGWILCPGRRTITGIIPFARGDSSRPHDAYHRFFRAGKWSVSKLWELWSIMIVKSLCNDLRVWLQTDDTVLKKTGRKIEGAKYCRDAVRSTKSKIVYAWGLQIVPICVRICPPWGGEPWAIPVNMRIYRKGGPSLLDLTESMIEELAEWLPAKTFCLVADGAYASLAGRDMPRTHVLSRMRQDAALYEMPPKKRPRRRGRPAMKGKRLPAPSEMVGRVKKWKLVTTTERGREKVRLVYTRRVLWYSVHKTAPVLLVISRDPEGKEKDDFFFTTDCSEAPETVVSEYANRWAIEDTFRNIKQFLGAEDPQCWKGDGPEKAATIAFFLYGLIWLWYLRHGHAEYQAPEREWYDHKQATSFWDALATIRLHIWRNQLNDAQPQEHEVSNIHDIILQAAAWAA